ncbi:MAG TPA: UbiA family prenyltransferase [Pirellulales bacterium]|jgi:4-hydroxybenzoate polyprenyltransferase
MPEPRLRSWLQLFRLSNVFTAMADIFLGYLLVHTSLAPWPVFLSLLAASCLMYTAGMVLNDVFDVAIDREERPSRPIPAGRVPLGLALHVGGVMLGAGLALGWVATFLSGQWRCGVVATLLAVMVVAYDRILKRTVLAPVAMGACRSLNVLLGASAADGEWRAIHWIIAGGLGLYIAGVTWFARREASASAKVQLVGAIVVIAAGLAVLAAFPLFADNTLPPDWQPVFADAIGTRWWMLWGVLGGWTILQCSKAVLDPKPAIVQAAVKHCIVSLVIFDAACCFAVRDVYWAAVIWALVIPTLWLGRWIYST